MRALLLGLLLLGAVSAEATTLTITEGGWTMLLYDFDGGFHELPNGQQGFAGEGFQITTLGVISGGLVPPFDLTLDGIHYAAPCPTFDWFCQNLTGLPPTGLDVLDPTGALVHFDLTGLSTTTTFCHVFDPQPHPGDRCFESTPDAPPLLWFSVQYHPAGGPASVPEPATGGLLALGLGWLLWWRRRLMA